MATIKINDNEIKISNRFGNTLDSFSLKQFTALIELHNFEEVQVAFKTLNKFAQLTAAKIISEGKDLHMKANSTFPNSALKWQTVDFFLKNLSTELSKQLSGKEAMVLRNIFVKDLEPLHQIGFCQNLKDIKFANYVYFNDVDPRAAAYVIKQNQFKELVRLDLQNTELNQSNINAVLEIITSHNVKALQILYKHSSIDLSNQIMATIESKNDFVELCHDHFKIKQDSSFKEKLSFAVDKIQPMLQSKINRMALLRFAIERRAEDSYQDEEKNNMNIQLLKNQVCDLVDNIVVKGALWKIISKESICIIKIKLYQAVMSCKGSNDHDQGYKEIAAQIGKVIPEILINEAKDKTDTSSEKIEQDSQIPHGENNNDNQINSFSQQQNHDTQGSYDTKIIGNDWQ